MTEIDPRGRRRAALTLFLARSVYAFNWYNIGAVLPLIGAGLRVSTVELGLVLGSFLLGAAIFQIPAGLASYRWGSRRVCLGALALMGIFATASAFSPDWYVMAALRFGVGAGAAFFFAPALGLVAAYYPPGSRGPIIGLYNAGFSLGAAIGILAGAVIGLAFGWSWALLVGGVALLIGAALASFALPETPEPERHRSFGELLGSAGPVLRSRPIWALAIGLMGLWAAYYIVAQYFVEFSSDVHPAWSLALAAALPTVMIVVEIVSGPIGGWLAERERDLRSALVVFGVPSAVAIVLVPFLPLAELALLFIFLGFANGVVFANLYLIPSYRPEVQGEGLTLALALINCVQIAGGSALAISFGYLAAYSGYTVAWVFAGVVGAVTLPLLAWVPGARARTSPAARSSDARAPPVGPSSL